MRNKTSRNLIIILFISVFLILYLIFLSTFSLNNQLNKISFVLIFGISIVIIGFFLFITLEPNKENNQLFGFKFLSENLIKIILAISMILAFFIPPVTFSTTIMDWSQIGIKNYIRAFIFIVGCAFLPGACAFNIMFPKSELHEKFKVESFVLKITFYPIFSLVLIGISVEILDRIGLIREHFTIVLFIIILTLLSLDLLVQFFRDKNILKNNLAEIKISKHTFYILIIAIGYSLFTIGVQMAVQYLIPGDAWVGVGSANFIGKPDVSPNRDIKTPVYPRFWGYIIFGLASLSGIPCINLNVLLTPFSYLSVTSMYLFIKSILSNHKDVYAVLATIFISLFTGFFYLTYNELGLGNISFETTKPTSLRLDFGYKNFAYILLYFSMGLFITSFKISSLKKEKSYITNKEFKILLLASLFLLMSYMIYMLPIIAGIYIPILYCIFFGKKKEKRKFQLFTIFLFLLFTLFMIFDILKEFWLSASFYARFSFIFSFIGLNSIKGVETPLVYGILWGIFFFFAILQHIHSKFFYKAKWNILKSKINTKYFFITLLTIFTSLMLLAVYNIVKSYYDFEFIYNSDNELFYDHLDYIFINIGIIGIIGIYLSYFCFQIKRSLFYFLISWIICAFFIASMIFFIMLFPIVENSKYTLDLNIIWLKRNWIYAIPAFSILASVGIMNLGEKLKNFNFRNRNFNFRNRNFNLILKLSIASILIFSSYSNIIVSGMRINSDKKMEDAEAQVVGWITEELPLDANILGERRYNIERLLVLFKEKNFEYFRMKDLFKSRSSFKSQLYKLKDLNIQYAVFYEDKHINIEPEHEDYIDNFLIQKIYYKVLYKYKGLVVYYAPDLEDDVDREGENYYAEISSFNNTDIRAEQEDSNFSISDSYRYSQDVKDFSLHKNSTLINEDNYDYKKGLNKSQT